MLARDPAAPSPVVMLKLVPQPLVALRLDEAERHPGKPRWVSGECSQSLCNLLRQPVAWSVRQVDPLDRDPCVTPLAPIVTRLAERQGTRARVEAMPVSGPFR